MPRKILALSGRGSVHRLHCYSVIDIKVFRVPHWMLTVKNGAVKSKQPFGRLYIDMTIQ